ncbi:hypothetical protein AAFC00_003233 [Neodothiora populina]|uniref:TAFII28-like protein domain-containing protein n=1 Tax=Neodothiora populina TaxID=2781224 RepID=A0ABR3P9S7_9PEZI
MASSPPGRALSPPSANPQFPMSKKRASVQLPTNQPSHKRRKPSTASLSAHPLRQTSFPPPDRFGGRAYSPDTQGSQVAYSPISRRSESLDIDDEITSVVSGRNNTSVTSSKKERAKKGTKTGRVGRPPKASTRDGTSSIIDGDTAPLRNKAAASAHGAQNANDAADDEEEADDDDAGEDGAGPEMEGGVRLTKAAAEQDKANKATFQLTMDKMYPPNAEQFGVWNSVHLSKPTVRRLTNQTLSQSVPASVVNAIAAYSKLFAGEIVDRAREVQKEWVAAAEKLPTGDKNEAAFGKDGEGEARVKEMDRGPLLPDHLREALRRYKLSREGGTVGFTGLSLEGKETVAARNGGRRLFR